MNCPSCHSQFNGSDSLTEAIGINRVVCKNCVSVIEIKYKWNLNPFFIVSFPLVTYLIGGIRLVDYLFPAINKDMKYFGLMILFMPILMLIEKILKSDYLVLSLKRLGSLQDLIGKFSLLDFYKSGIKFIIPLLLWVIFLIFVNNISNFTDWFKVVMALVLLSPLFVVLATPAYFSERKKLNELLNKNNVKD